MTWTQWGAMIAVGALLIIGMALANYVMFGSIIAP